MVVVVVTSKRPFDTGCRVAPFEFRNFCFQSHDFTLALLVAPAIVVVELDLALSSSFFVSALSMSDLVDRVMSPSLCRFSKCSMYRWKGVSEEPHDA
jgi:hypothetical protein